MSIASFTDLLSNPLYLRRYGNWIGEFSPLDSNGDPLTISGQPSGALRVSSRVEGYRTLPTDSTPNAQYRNHLSRLTGGSGGLELRSSLWSSTDGIAIGGTSLPNDSDKLIIANPDGYYDQYSPRLGYLWDGKPCVVRFGSGFGLPNHRAYLPFSQFRPFYFEMGEPTYSLGRVEIPIYSLSRRFDHPLNELTFRGTGFCIGFAAGNYIQVGTIAKLDLTGAMTYEGWHFVDNLTNSRFAAGWQGGTRTPWRIRVSNTGALGFQYTHSGGTLVAQQTATGAVVTGRWYHLAVTVSGTTGQFIIYDGLTGVETITPFTLSAATRDANVGGAVQLSVNSAGQSWVGRLDEQRVWNVTRTLSEVRAHRHGPFDIVPATLVGYYKHNDGPGSLVTTDSATSPANGSLTGASWIHSFTGSSPLSGHVQPDVVGRAEFHEPVLVDEVTHTYKVASGAVQSITVFEGMAPLTSDGADIADEVTLYNTVVTSGRYRTCLAFGLFKLGSSPVLPITCHVEGYSLAGDTKASIIRWSVTTRGPSPLSDPSDLDTGAFTTLDAADDSLHGMMVTDRMTIREFVNHFIGPGCWAGYHLDSQLFTVKQWTGPSVTADLTIPSSRILRFEPADDLIRYWKVILAYGKIRPHSETEISLTIKGSSANAAVYQRGLKSDGWSEALAEDYDVKSNHSRAREVRWETAIQYPPPGVTIGDPEGRDAALREAQRIQALLGQGLEPYRFVLDAFGLQLRLSDTIAPVVKIQGEYRLGFDGTRNLSVLGVEVDPVTWQVTVVAVG